MEIKELCFFLLLLSANTIGSVVEDTSENGVISYDQDSVDLIVNIALSLFDSLQDYTKQINETEDKVKVKFKPKLVIEEVDIESDPTHDNLLFLEQEPEFRKINNAEEDIYDSVNEINLYDKDKENLKNHRNNALKDSDAKKIAIKMALNDKNDEVQGYVVDIISLNNKDEGKNANHHENDFIIDDEKNDEEFSFHKEFPNIYSQSDSIFDIVQENEQMTMDAKHEPSKLKVQEKDFVDISGSDEIVSDRRVDEDIETNLENDKINETPKLKQKKRKRRKRKKRPFDGRENWDKLNKAIFGEESNEKALTELLQKNPKMTEIEGKKKRRRKKRKGSVKKSGLKKVTKQPPNSKPLKSKTIVKNFSKIHLAKKPMPKIQLRGRPINLQSFLNLF